MADLVGVATWNFGEGTLAERIDRFAGMGFNAVGLNTRDARPLARGEMPDVDDAILRHGLPVTIHGGLAPKGEEIQPDAVLADFKSITAWQARTGALVSVNFDAAKSRADSGVFEPQTEAMHRVLKEMLVISDGAGFTVGIEDWPLTAEHHRVVEDLMAFGHYGMLLDLGHMNMRIRKNTDPNARFPIDAAREYLDQMALPVNELHVHNNDGVHDLHAPPTSGTADLTAVASLLAAKGVKCISTIELVPAWCGLTEEQGWEGLPKALEFWRQVF